MGLLDDAIREHLDLKRRRGADPAEIERAERDALGPVRRDPVGSGEAEIEHAAMPDGNGGYEEESAYDHGFEEPQRSSTLRSRPSLRSPRLQRRPSLRWRRPRSSSTRSIRRPRCGTSSSPTLRGWLMHRTGATLRSRRIRCPSRRSCREPRIRSKKSRSRRRLRSRTRRPLRLRSHTSRPLLRPSATRTRAPGARPAGHAAVHHRAATARAAARRPSPGRARGPTRQRHGRVRPGARGGRGRGRPRGDAGVPAGHARSRPPVVRAASAEGLRLRRVSRVRLNGQPLDSPPDRGHSSVGRAPALHAGGHGFESRWLH